MRSLFTGKQVIADKGYRSEKATISSKNDFDSSEVKKFKRRALAWQENINMRIKRYKVVEERFRHGNKDDHNFHKACFEVCCILVQYEIEGDAPLFNV